jgi:hypothetical protein
VIRSSLFLFCAAATAITLAVPATTATAAGGGSGPVNRAYAAAVAAQRAFEARMAARETRHPAAPAQRAGATTRFSGRITDVQPIAADTAPSINGAEPDTETEPDVAIDPGNPSVITGGAQQGRYVDGGSADPGYSTSHDGGRTWIHANLPGLTEAVGGTFQRASDIAIAFGPDGSDYAQTIPFDQTDARSAVAVQRSVNGGVTFGAPVLVVNDNNIDIFNDKNWIAVDTSRRSPYHGRIYTVWSRFITTGSVTHSPGAVSWSDDHGRTWSKLRFTGPATEDTEGLLPLIAADGTITVVYDQTIGGQDYETAQTSYDGGAVWTKPVNIAEFLGAGVPGMRTGGLPSAAIDPATGRIYVVWQDTRFNSAGLNDIVLAESSDHGRTWSAPRAVSPARAGLDRFTPAVAAVDGKVYVSYRTRAADGTAPTVTEDLIVSDDGGSAFGPERQIGPATVLTYAAVADTTTTAFLGDYMGLAAVRRETVLTWCVATAPRVAETYHQLVWAAVIG